MQNFIVSVVIHRVTHCVLQSFSFVCFLLILFLYIRIGYNNIHTVRINLTVYRQILKSEKL